MADDSPRHHDGYLKYIIAALAVALLILVVVFVIQFRNLRHAELRSEHASFVAMFLRHHPTPLMAEDVDLVQSWMTFDYVARLFALPPDYLKTSLNISDVRYPRLTIGSAATVAHATSTVAYLGQVRTVVAQYFANATSSASSTIKSQ